MNEHELPAIDDFHVGQRAEFRKTFTDEDIEHFVAITGDENPLHVDDEFAARTFFGRRITHGMLTASILSTMVGMLLPGRGAIYRSQTLEFRRPVYVGETVIAIFEITAIDRESSTIEIDSRIVNEKDAVVIDGRCVVGLIRGLS